MTVDNTKYPKRPRIKDFSYEGCYAYFLTICTDQKKKIFVCGASVALVLPHLAESAQAFSFSIYAYCFMPDHLHFLAIAQNKNANLTEFIKRFKQKSGYYYKKEYQDKLWQPSYYDHVLRKREGLNDIAEYILFNPVRNKMVDDYKAYPFCGYLNC